MLVALDQNCGIERERRQRRKAAENSCRQEQPPCLAGISSEREPFGENSHDERACDIDGQRAEGKADTEELRSPDVYAMPHCAAYSGPNKDSQISIHCGSISIASPNFH